MSCAGGRIRYARGIPCAPLEDDVALSIPPLERQAPSEELRSLSGPRRVELHGRTRRVTVRAKARLDIQTKPPDSNHSVHIGTA